MTKVMYLDKTSSFMDNSADIGTGEWGDLSNFTPRPFVFHGYTCSSMEGFLQSLKFPLLEKQSRVRAMSGVQAKRIGKKKKWYLDQTLYWIDKPIDRHSNEYISLVAAAFNSLYQQDANYRYRLRKTRGLNLTHAIGKSDPRKTILTEQEFIQILTYLREK